MLLASFKRPLLSVPFYHQEWDKRQSRLSEAGENVESIGVEKRWSWAQLSSKQVRIPNFGRSWSLHLAKFIKFMLKFLHKLIIACWWRSLLIDVLLGSLFRKVTGDYKQQPLVKSQLLRDWVSYPGSVAFSERILLNSLDSLLCLQIFWYENEIRSESRCLEGPWDRCSEFRRLTSAGIWKLLTC